MAFRVSFWTTLSYGACSSWTSMPVFAVKSGRRLSRTWLLRVASAIIDSDVPSLARDHAPAPLAAGEPPPAAAGEAPPAPPADEPPGVAVPPQAVTRSANAPNAETHGRPSDLRPGAAPRRRVIRVIPKP